MRSFYEIKNNCPFKRTPLCIYYNGVIFVDLNNVYKKIEDNNIKIFPFGVPDYKAVTIKADNKYGIFMNYDAIKNSNEEFCVAVHEYGHCMTDTVHSPDSDKILIAKHEYKADRKSIIDFLPVEKIYEAFDSGCQTLYEVSCFLDLPEEFVEKALNHYRCMNLL